MNRWIDQQLGDATVQHGMAVIGEIVRRGRQGAGITQQRLAASAGLNQSTISRLKRGELRAMRLVRLARVIGSLVRLGGLPPSQMRRRQKRAPESAVPPTAREEYAVDAHGRSRRESPTRFHAYLIEDHDDGVIQRGVLASIRLKGA